MLERFEGGVERGPVSVAECVELGRLRAGLGEELCGALLGSGDGGVGASLGLGEQGIDLLVGLAPELGRLAPRLPQDLVAGRREPRRLGAHRGGETLGLGDETIGVLTSSGLGLDGERHLIDSRVGHTFSFGRPGPPLRSGPTRVASVESPVEERRQLAPSDYLVGAVPIVGRRIAPERDALGRRLVAV